MLIYYYYIFTFSDNRFYYNLLIFVLRIKIILKNNLGNQELNKKYHFVLYYLLVLRNPLFLSQVVGDIYTMLSEIFILPGKGKRDRYYADSAALILVICEILSRKRTPLNDVSASRSAQSRNFLLSLTDVVWRLAASRRHRDGWASVTCSHAATTGRLIGLWIQQVRTDVRRLQVISTQALPAASSLTVDRRQPDRGKRPFQRNSRKIATDRILRPITTISLLISMSLFFAIVNCRWHKLDRLQSQEFFLYNSLLIFHFFCIFSLTENMF